MPLWIERATRKQEAAESARAARVAGRRYRPARLLDPGLQVVPFTGREAELAALQTWCRDASAGFVRLVVSGGGAGKTRLAQELCRRMAAESWQCLPVGERDERAVLGREREAAPKARLRW